MTRQRVSQTRAGYLVELSGRRSVVALVDARWSPCIIALDTSEDVGISSRDLDNLRGRFLNNTDANPAVILNNTFSPVSGKLTDIPDCGTPNAKKMSIFVVFSLKILKLCWHQIL